MIDKEYFSMYSKLNIKITFFVFLCDRDLLSVRDKLFGNHFAKVVVKITESIALLHGVLLQPQHRCIEIVILLLQIFQLEVLTQNHLIERSCKERINQHALR